MKMKALANLSGKVGKVKKGAEFTADAATAKDLIERKAAVEVAAAPAADPKAKRAAKE